MWVGQRVRYGPLKGLLESEREFVCSVCFFGQFDRNVDERAMSI